MRYPHYMPATLFTAHDNGMLAFNPQCCPFLQGRPQPETVTSSVVIGPKSNLAISAPFVRWNWSSL